MVKELLACFGASCTTTQSSVGILLMIAFVNTFNYLGFLAHSVITRDLESIVLVLTHLPACLFWQAYGWFVTLHTSLLHAISWGNRPDDTAARNGMRCKSAVLGMLVFAANALAIVHRKQAAQLLPYVYVVLAGPNVLMQLMAVPLRLMDCSHLGKMPRSEK